MTRKSRIVRIGFTGIELRYERFRHTWQTLRRSGRSAKKLKRSMDRLERILRDLGIPPRYFAVPVPKPGPRKGSHDRRSRPTRFLRAILGPRVKELESARGEAAQDIYDFLQSEDRRWRVASGREISEADLLEAFHIAPEELKQFTLEEIEKAAGVKPGKKKIPYAGKRRAQR